MKDYILEFAACQGKQDNQGYPCIRYSEEHKPLYMFPSESARIMLISESPSERASIRRALNTYDNPTFIEGILPLIFGISEPFDELKKEFDENFYWTHFCKCFPGSGYEKKLNSVCASNYLKDEIEKFKPQLIIAIGSPASKFLFGIGRRKSMSPLVNQINFYKLLNGTAVPTICITHFSGENRDAKKKELKFEETRNLIIKTLAYNYGVRHIRVV